MKIQLKIKDKIINLKTTTKIFKKCYSNKLTKETEWNPKKGSNNPKLIKRKRKKMGQIEHKCLDDRFKSNHIIKCECSKSPNEGRNDQIEWNSKTNYMLPNSNVETIG